ncbi:Nucleoid occlusion protein [subsurface metagenome]
MGAEVRDIPVEDIQVGDYALRMEADDEGIEELAVSIRRLGIISPLVVTREGEVIKVVAGHRRLAAARLAGLKVVPCILTARPVAGSKEVSMAENLFRKDLSPIELAAAMKDAVESGCVNYTTLAEGLHRAKHWVHSMIALLDWPVDVQKAVHAGWLSVSAASNLALITDDSYRGFLLRNAQENGATARTTAAWLQAWRSLAPAEQAVQAEPGPAGERATPLAPQAPCICCSEVFRTDQLCHVPVCSACVTAIRNARP